MIKTQRGYDVIMFCKGKYTNTIMRSLFYKFNRLGLRITTDVTMGTVLVLLNLIKMIFVKNATAYVLQQ